MVSTVPASSRKHLKATHLLFRQLGVQPYDIDQILLHDPHIRKVLSIHGLQLLALSFLLLLGLRQPFDPYGAEKRRVSKSMMRFLLEMLRNSLFGCHGLELYCLIRVLSATSWAATIEILLDVMPAETTDLYEDGMLLAY